MRIFGWDPYFHVLLHFQTKFFIPYLPFPPPPVSIYDSDIFMKVVQNECFVLNFNESFNIFCLPSFLVDKLKSGFDFKVVQNKCFVFNFNKSFYIFFLSSSIVDNINLDIVNKVIQNKCFVLNFINFNKSFIIFFLSSFKQTSPIQILLLKLIKINVLS